MPEENDQLNESQISVSQNSSSFFSNKLKLTGLSIWLILILAYAFNLSGVFTQLNIHPQFDLQSEAYLSNARFYLFIMTVISIINFIIIIIGLKKSSIARIIILYIDPLVLMLVIMSSVASVSSRCEGLSCIGNGLMFVAGLLILISIFIHAPILYLSLNQVSKKILAIIASFFCVSLVLVPLISYFYLTQVFPERVAKSISDSRYQNYFTIYRLTYFPTAGMKSKGEDYNPISYKYSIYVNYFENKGLVYITQSKPKGELQKIIELGGRRIKINGNDGVILTDRSFRQDEAFSSTIVWISDSTEIKLDYGPVKGTKESVEKEAIKIAESMVPREEQYSF